MIHPSKHRALLILEIGLAPRGEAIPAISKRFGVPRRTLQSIAERMEREGAIVPIGTRARRKWCLPTNTIAMDLEQARRELWGDWS